MSRVTADTREIIAWLQARMDAGSTEPVLEQMADLLETYHEFETANCLDPRSKQDLAMLVKFFNTIMECAK